MTTSPGTRASAAPAAAPTGSAPPLAPEGSGLPVLGSILDFRRDILLAMHRGWRDHGDLVRYRLGPVVVHGVSSPELAAEVLTDSAAYGKLGPDNPLRLILGEGLLTSDDHESWMRNRRMMQPIYTKQAIARMYESMSASTAAQVAHMARSHRSGDVVDIHGEMMRVTLDIVSRCMFSTDVEQTRDGISPEAVDVAINYAFDRLQNPFSPPTHWPTPRNRRFRRVMEGIDAMTYGIIAERRAAAAAGTVRGDGTPDLLDMLLEVRDADTGQGMSDREVRDEVITTFGAGHETTAITLTWAFYLLSRHREVLRRVQEEVDAVLGDAMPTMADLAAMPYALQVFEEALRLYPSAPIVPRLALRDTELGGYTVPAGSRLLVDLFTIHRHERHWEDPERFDPDRFSAEGKRGRHRFAHMPFGAGPHLCIGKHFALMEAHLLLAALVRRYEFRHVPAHRVVNQASITLRPRYGMEMTVHTRSRATGTG
ncbi:cytochrome P450 [Streptomyces bohaiensis]|uniref:Cytochrome P450 n=2 Tax=Streptomyces bohaiensis TaxID=1431344 RepID=A0ABX1C6W0_9ACTN|nr:cytochrome P450 [Streptomyces bohaiensis]NJQ13693.1 cytochrome P450 [Streptomyces bohaiensis]